MSRTKPHQEAQHASRLPVEGVYLSSTVDLKARFGANFASASHILRIRDPDEITDPSEVRFALSWEPADSAFAAYPHLQMVSSVGAGVDCILRCSSLPARAVVTRVRDKGQALAMAGFVVWHVIWHHRRMGQYIVNAANRVWRWAESCPVDECTVGLLGLGMMGRAVANALAALGYSVVVARRTTPPEGTTLGLTVLSGMHSIEDIAAKSNILVNLLPLTRETRGVLNADLFSLMPRGSSVIQVGRGEHLVEDDLRAALDSGKLAGASIDVLSVEPPASDHWCWADPRVLVTPHVACECEEETVVAQVTACVEDLVAARTPRFAINREKEY